MEIKVEKVKDILTGGSVTPADKSLSLTYKTFNGFTGYFDSHDNNPMYNATRKEGDLPKCEPKDVFK